MRNGDSGIIRFKFKYGVEFIDKGAKLMVREGNTKAFGFVKEIYTITSPPKDLDINDRYTMSAKKIDIANKENI